MCSFGSSITWQTDSYQSEGSINESLWGRPLTMETEVVPQTLGIISDPPTLVLIYEEIKSSGGKGSLDGTRAKRKLRKRKIPVRQFTDKSNAEKFARNIQIRHESYLSSVPVITIEKMLRIIQEVIKGLHPDEAATKVYSEYSINPEEDLNKLSLEEVSRKKLIMDETFERNRLKPNDPGYEYDKQVDFQIGNKVNSGWDDDEAEGNKSKDEDSAIPIVTNAVSEVTEFNEGHVAGITDEIDIIETILDNDDEDDFW